MWSNGRLPERLEPTEYARALEEACETATESVYDLTASNPSRFFEDHRERVGAELVEAAREAARAPYEPDPHGLLQTREAVAAYYARRDVEIDPDQVTISASTSEAYSWLAKLLADPGGDVLVPTPSYPLFEHLMALESLSARPYRFGYDGDWHLDTGDLRRRIDACDDPRAVVCVTPNNPTGHVLGAVEFEHLCEICTSRDIPLIIDEVFVDFGLEGGRPTSIVERLEKVDDADRPLVFTLSGLSKTAGMPGVKLGWIVVQGSHRRLHQARERLEFVADTFLSASTVSQRVAPRVLSHLDRFHATVSGRTRRNVATLRSELDSLPTCEVYPAEAGWYAVVRLPNILDPEDLTLELARRDALLVQPGFLYDFERGAHVVLSLLPPRRRFEKGVERLRRRLSDRIGTATEV